MTATLRPGWKHLGIRTKFICIFVLLLALLLLIAVTAYFCTHSIHLAEEQIRKSNNIAQKVLEMDRGMERAYRLHGNFFLHFQNIGLRKAHELYAQPSVRQISRVIGLSNELKRLLFSSGEMSIEGIHQADLNLYLASARRFADTSIESFELLSERAAPDRGLEAQLGTLCQALKAGALNHTVLQNTFSAALSFYKDYLIERQRSLMQSSLNEMSILRATILQDPSLSSPRKQDLFSRLDSYNVLADRLLAVDLAIAGKMHDFHLQRQMTTPISNALIQITESEAAAAEKRIDRLNVVTRTVIPLSALLATLMLLYISRLIHNSVTRNVLMLTAAATAFSQGDLDARVAEEGRDELGRLGTIFNHMAARLQILIENLEGEVQRRTEDLARSEERFRQLFDHSSSGVLLLDPIDGGQNFLIRDFNRAGEKIEQRSRDDLIGRTVTDAFPGIEEMGLLDTLRLVLKTGEPLHPPALFYKNSHIEGCEGWRDVRAYRLPSGEVVAVYDDVTGQRLAEEEKLAMEQSLQRAQKMEAIGLMAGGIAHDLNNTLSAIIGYPDLLLLRLPQDSSLRPPLTTIKEAGERAAAVVADLLTVARGVASTRQITDLNTLIQEYCSSPEFAGITVQYPHIEFQRQLAAELNTISCSPLHVKKCLMNLIVNGIEAMEQSGTLVLATHSAVPEQAVLTTFNLQPVSHAVLSISDNGPGIPDKDLSHIFEPFYTKRVMGKTGGTGLGLSVVWNIMKEHDGAVVAISSSLGTTFELYFPEAAEAAVSRHQPQEFSDLKGNGETILVIDDEEMQCRLARQILEYYGYRVTSRNSGETAVEYLESRKVDLVILDMIMDPGINGRETYAEISKIHPGQKAIIASGFSESEDVRATLEMGADTFIKKPYSMQELAGTVKRILRK